MNSLSTRMKRYEASFKYLISPRTYTIVRVDGKNFSKFTKGMKKPFDDQFSDSMDYAALELCKYFNPAFAYTQSDEISLVFTDFGENTQQIFDGKVQKLCSLTASVAATNFNKKMLMMDMELCEDVDDIKYIIDGSLIHTSQFDSRVFVIPDFVEVNNYFVWRQQDASRNSVSMAASALYSHNELMGKSGSDKQDLMMEKGVNWNDYAVKYKRGVIIKKEEYQIDVPLRDGNIGFGGTVTRKRWMVDNEIPIFHQEKDYLKELIPSSFPTTSE